MTSVFLHVSDYVTPMQKAKFVNAAIRVEEQELEDEAEDIDVGPSISQCNSPRESDGGSVKGSAKGSSQGHQHYPPSVVRPSMREPLHPSRPNSVTHSSPKLHKNESYHSFPKSPHHHNHNQISHHNHNHTNHTNHNPESSPYPALIPHQTTPPCVIPPLIFPTTHVSKTSVSNTSVSNTHVSPLTFSNAQISDTGHYLTDNYNTGPQYYTLSSSIVSQAPALVPTQIQNTVETKHMIQDFIQELFSKKEKKEKDEKQEKEEKNMIREEQWKCMEEKIEKIETKLETKITRKVIDSVLPRLEQISSRVNEAVSFAETVSSRVVEEVASTVDEAISSRWEQEGKLFLKTQDRKPDQKQMEKVSQIPKQSQVMCVLFLAGSFFVSSVWFLMPFTLDHPVTILS